MQNVFSFCYVIIEQIYLYALIFCNANYHRICHQDIDIESLINSVWFYKLLDLTCTCMTSSSGVIGLLISIIMYQVKQRSSDDMIGAFTEWSTRSVYM